MSTFSVKPSEIDKKWVLIDAKDLVVGDVMMVRPGERIATDGVIRDGRTALDVSAITGESVPVEAGPGDEVFAGTINGTGALTVDPDTRQAAKEVTLIAVENGEYVYLDSFLPEYIPTVD